MLVLSTRNNDKIHIGDKITIKVLNYSKTTDDLLIEVQSKKSIERVLLTSTPKSIYKKVNMSLVEGRGRGGQYKVGIEAPKSMLILRDKDNYKNTLKYKRQQMRKKQRKRMPLPVFEKTKDYKTKDNKFDVNQWLKDNLSSDTEKTPK